jgi:hypothetical protein
MPIISEAPEITTREIKLEEPVNALLEGYARFMASDAHRVSNAALKKVLWRDPDYRGWRESRRNPALTRPNRSVPRHTTDAKRA